jgi:hypothetical protein
VRHLRAADSPVRTPADLAGVPISVGYQSGSHYATIQGLEQYLTPEAIKLSFNDGLLFSRMEMLIDRKLPFSGPYYFAEGAQPGSCSPATRCGASPPTSPSCPGYLRAGLRLVRPSSHLNEV